MKNKLHKYLFENQKEIIAKKKAVKHESICEVFSFPTDIKINAEKNLKEDTDDVIYRTAIANTINFMDGDRDVHLKDIWKKTLQESGKEVPLLNQHRNGLENELIHRVKPYVMELSWQQLGYKENSMTQALMVDLELERDVLPDYMWRKYKRNEIKQYSVGMQYVKIFLALNNPDYKDEYSKWNEYYKFIVNPEEADKDGMFWGVTEAKLFEISPVSRGSNSRTGNVDYSKIKYDIKNEPETPLVDYTNIYEKLQKINSLIK